MKKIIYSLVGMKLITLLACNDMYDLPVHADLPDMPGESGIMYVLSEGLFNMNNSSLSRVNFENRIWQPDFFPYMNERGLGDTANDMQLYEGKLWIVVNVSSQIEVLDATTGIALRRIPLFAPNGTARQPRYITFAENKAYVCSLDGTVTRIDIATLTVDGITNAGRNPDGITIANAKLYVSNSGGLDKNYDNTISVIDINSFTEIRKITAGMNPFTLKTDSEGDVYAVSRGDNAGIKARFIRISSTTDEVVDVFDTLPAINFTLHNDTAYLYSYDFVTNSYWVKTFDCRTERIISDHFITDGTVMERPFGIYMHPKNGNVYITDARNYIVKGDLLCFSRHGKLLYKIENVGLNPNSVICLP